MRIGRGWGDGEHSAIVILELGLILVSLRLFLQNIIHNKGACLNIMFKYTNIFKPVMNLYSLCFFFIVALSL